MLGIRCCDRFGASGVDVIGNCDRVTDFPDFWSNDPYYAGSCVATLRAHEQVVELHSYERSPRIPELQHIDYKATDKSYNSRPNATHLASNQLIRRTVRLVDETEPTLLLNGNSSIRHEGGDQYYEPWASCVDVLDGECTASIRLEIRRQSTLQCTKLRGCDFQGCVEQGCEATTITPFLCIDKPCDATRITPFAPVNTQFVMYYTAVDRAGNSITVQRNLTIIDTRIPVLHLHGVTPMPLEGATTYYEPGANATDELDDDVIDREQCAN